MAMRYYDTGHGRLWVYLESLGPVGIVRARTFEEAYAAAIDEIMNDADPTDPNTYARSYDESAETSELAEGCHWRGSGEPSNPGLSSPIAQEDLNGSYLTPLRNFRRPDFRRYLNAAEIRKAFRGQE